MKQNRALIFIAAVVMAASLAICSGSQSKVQAQESQPHMQAALAEHDKGGHRANATKLVEQAIAEVDAGIHYADKH